jgi:hypothetical protein
MRAFPSTNKAACTALLASLLGLMLVDLRSAAAAQATSTISVTITGPVSTVSLATGIRFSTIGLPGAGRGLSLSGTGQQGVATDGTGNISVSESGLATGSGNLPGSFVVSGERGQVFSISLPQKVILNLDGVFLELRAFRHSGGSTPSTGPDGTVSIAFMADVNRDQLEIFQNIAMTSVDTGNIYLEIPADAIAAQSIAVAGEDEDAPLESQWIATRKPVPFGTPDEFDKLIFVLISYN